jgi:hypothetical protein
MTEVSNERQSRQPSLDSKDIYSLSRGS